MQNPQPAKSRLEFFCLACNGQKPCDKLGDKTGYDVLACRTCGSLGISPFPTVADIESAVENGQYQAPFPKFKLRQIDKHLKLVAPDAAGKSFLHVQCFGGEVVNMAKTDHNFTVKGIDTSPDVIELAKKTYGDPFFETASIYDLVDRGETFDYIYVQEGIESMIDPSEYLEMLKKLMAPAGKLHVRTWDGNHFMMPRRFAQWKDFSPPAHCFLYSRVGMWALLKRHGFVLKKRFKHYLHPYLEFVVSQAPQKP